VLGSYLHGNENKANQASGTNGAGAYVSGTEWLPGYAVVNIEGTHHVGESVDAFARI
jgi:hypothetical protein